MSIKRMSAVWEHSTHKGGDLLVLLALADNADEEGFCWPSMATLEQKSRLSHATMIRVCERLEQSGELFIYHNRRRGNRYIVAVGLDDSAVSQAMKNKLHFTGETLSRNMELFKERRSKYQIETSEVSPVIHDPSLTPKASDALPESSKASVREPRKAKPRNAVFDKVAEYAFGIQIGAPIGAGTAARVGKILAELKASRGGVYPDVATITAACLAWKYAHRGLDLPRDPAKFDAMIREWETSRSTPPADDTLPAVLATTTPQQRALDSMYRKAEGQPS